MEESKLQREFKGRDVQRMRNIITKDYNAKTTTQVGYSKAYIDRKEGDVWEEYGKKWILKNNNFAPLFLRSCKKWIKYKSYNNLPESMFYSVL